MSKLTRPIPFDSSQREGAASGAADEPAAAQRPSREHLPDVLSRDDRELLSGAVGELVRGRVPVAVRERMFARVIDEARRPQPKLATPASPLVPVRARGVWLVLGSAAAMAFGLVLLANARALFRGSGDALDASGSDGPPRAEQHLGDRIFQSALFRAPAPAWSGALPPLETNLFGERPFSPQSHAWQVKRWDDLNLGMPPTVPAQYSFEQGALCVSLRGGARIVGGWPWLPNGEAEPTPAPGTPGAPPAAVPLSAGRAYRLVFKAWASEPLPSQVLIAVGHAELPYSGVAGARVEVSTTPEPFGVSFVAKHDDASVGVAFFASASEGAPPTRVCLSDVTLSERPR